MRQEFNSNIYGNRLVPPTPEGLADRIIARAMVSAADSNLMMMLILPRPYLILSILFVLSIVAGSGFDLGFNSPEIFTVSEQDILYSVDNSFSGDLL